MQAVVKYKDNNGKWTGSIPSLYRHRALLDVISKESGYSDSWGWIRHVVKSFCLLKADSMTPKEVRKWADRAVRLMEIE